MVLLSRKFDTLRTGPLEVNLGMLKRFRPHLPLWVGNPDRYAGKRQIVSALLDANF